MWLAGYVRIFGLGYLEGRAPDGGGSSRIVGVARFLWTLQSFEIRLLDLSSQYELGVKVEFNGLFVTLYSFIYICSSPDITRSYYIEYFHP